MPRIDPKQLLKTLGVLLSPDGGIKSTEEVARLAQLMHKFSKKLVSKCIYVHILKATSPNLLEQFLNESGWDLVNQWFIDSLRNQNWALTKELLKLFYICPMTADLLKDKVSENEAPRLINQMRRESGVNQSIKLLAEEVYKKWALIISPNMTISGKKQDLRMSTRARKVRIPGTRKVNSAVESKVNPLSTPPPLPKLIIKVTPPLKAGIAISDTIDNEADQVKPVNESKLEIEDAFNNQTRGEGPKTSAEVVGGASLSLLQSLAEEVSDNLKKEEIATANVVEKKVKIKEIPSKKSSTKENAKPENRKRKEDSSKSTSSSASPPSPSSTEDIKAAKKIKRDRPHHPRDEVNDDQKLHIKAMAKKLKEEAQAKKDKDTLKIFSAEKMTKIPKIPKKPAVNSDISPSEKKESKKSGGGPMSFSDLLGGLDAKPKTVKTPLNRNKTAALLEGLSNTKPTTKTSSTIPSKQPSSDSKTKQHNHKKDSKDTISSSSSKKDSPLSLGKREATKPVVNGSSLTDSKKKPETPESPKPKKDVHNFHESSSFMDAIFSSMGHNEAPRKKKRRLSDKDESSSKSMKVDSDKKKLDNEDGKDDAEKDITPSIQAFSFYRDTLEDENSKEEDEALKSAPPQSSSESEKKDEESPCSPPKTEDDLPFEEPTDPLPREVKGILVYHRGKNKRNKAISWKAETDLTSVRYFELDETERVNVNKLKYDFSNMRKMEFELEKAALKSKGSLEQDEEIVNKWYKPLPITVENRTPFMPGGSSKEKEIQATRELKVLQAIYFSKDTIPDSPAEPENSELNVQDSPPPIRIPLDDKEGIPEESVKDFSKHAWPSPKVNEVDQESSLENAFSLPPSLSNFLSTIGSGTIQNLIPPNMANLSQEEQNTLAAQTQAMQKLGMIPPAASAESGGHFQQPRPDNIPPPPLQQHMQSDQHHEHFAVQTGSFNNGPPHSFSGGPPNLPPPSLHIPPINNELHPPPHHHQQQQQPNNYNNHQHHHNPPTHHHHHHQQQQHHHNRGGGYHNGGGRGGNYNNDRRGGGGFRHKDHRENNRDFRDRSRDHHGGGRRGGGGEHNSNPRPCKFFTQRGHCRDGERCRFAHER